MGPISYFFCYEREEEKNSVKRWRQRRFSLRPWSSSSNEGSDSGSWRRHRPAQHNSGLSSQHLTFGSTFWPLGNVTVWSDVIHTWGCLLFLISCRRENTIPGSVCLPPTWQGSSCPNKTTEGWSPGSSRRSGVFAKQQTLSFSGYLNYW